jgi:hypothetical protein
MANAGHAGVLEMHTELRRAEVAARGSSEASVRLARIQSLLSGEWDATKEQEDVMGLEVAPGGTEFGAEDRGGDEEMWAIPTLPRGQVLKIWIETTWGDRLQLIAPERTKPCQH